MKELKVNNETNEKTNELKVNTLRRYKPGQE